MLFFLVLKTSKLLINDDAISGPKTVLTIISRNSLPFPQKSSRSYDNLRFFSLVNGIFLCKNRPRHRFLESHPVFSKKFFDTYLRLASPKIIISLKNTVFSRKSARFLAVLSLIHIKFWVSAPKMVFFSQKYLISCTKVAFLVNLRHQYWFYYNKGVKCVCPF